MVSGAGSTERSIGRPSVPPAAGARIARDHAWLSPRPGRSAAAAPRRAVAVPKRRLHHGNDRGDLVAGVRLLAGRGADAVGGRSGPFGGADLGDALRLR